MVNGRRRQRIGVLGVPMDLGQSRRGVDMGPSAVRYARLRETLEELGHTVSDLGNIGVPIPEEAAGRDDGAGIAHLRTIREICERTAEAARDAVADSVFPIFLGGDHSISIGTVSGVASARDLRSSRSTLRRPKRTTSSARTLAPSPPMPTSPG